MEICHAGTKRESLDHFDRSRISHCGGTHRLQFWLKCAATEDRCQFHRWQLSNDHAESVFAVLYQKLRWSTVCAMTGLQPEAIGPQVSPWRLRAVRALALCSLLAAGIMVAAIVFPITDIGYGLSKEVFAVGSLRVIIAMATKYGR
jgi:hypothetical protein